MHERSILFYFIGRIFPFFWKSYRLQFQFLLPNILRASVACALLKRNLRATVFYYFIGIINYQLQTVFDFSQRGL